MLGGEQLRLGEGARGALLLVVERRVERLVERDQDDVDRSDRRTVLLGQAERRRETSTPIGPSLTGTRILRYSPSFDGTMSATAGRT